MYDFVAEQEPRGTQDATTSSVIVVVVVAVVVVVVVVVVDVIHGLSYLHNRDFHRF